MDFRFFSQKFPKIIKINIVNILCNKSFNYCFWAFVNAWLKSLSVESWISWLWIIYNHEIESSFASSTTQHLWRTSYSVKGAKSLNNNHYHCTSSGSKRQRIGTDGPSKKQMSNIPVIQMIQYNNEIIWNHHVTQYLGAWTNSPSHSIGGQMHPIWRWDGSMWWGLYLEITWHLPRYILKNM